MPATEAPRKGGAAYRFSSPIAIHRHTPHDAANLLRALANTIETQEADSPERVSDLRVSWMEMDGQEKPFLLEEWS